MDTWELAKLTAKRIKKNPDPVEWLARWWSQKYNLPWNHELFQERTIFDLLVEYHLDFFDKHPLEVHRQADGEIVLTDTGDALIDKWEQDIAAGKEPNLWEAFSEEDQERIQKLRKKAERAAQGHSLQDTMDRMQRIEQSQGLKSPGTMTKRLSTFGTGLNPDE